MVTATIVVRNRVSELAGQEAQDRFNAGNEPLDVGVLKWSNGRRSGFLWIVAPQRERALVSDRVPGKPKVPNIVEEFGIVLPNVFGSVFASQDVHVELTGMNGLRSYIERRCASDDGRLPVGMAPHGLRQILAPDCRWTVVQQVIRDRGPRRR
jgi:hypothetical protein